MRRGRIRHAVATRHSLSVLSVVTRALLVAVILLHGLSQSCRGSIHQRSGLRNKKDTIPSEIGILFVFSMGEYEILHGAYLLVCMSDGHSDDDEDE